MTEARVVRDRIAGLGRALQDPIDQQILWHLLSAERAGPVGVHLALAPCGTAMEDGEASRVGSVDGHPLGEIEVTPSRTAEVTRQAKAEVRVHYRMLFDEGLIERKRRIPQLGWPEHVYALSPGVRPVLEAVSAFVLPESPSSPAIGDAE